MATQRGLMDDLGVSESDLAAPKQVQLAKLSLRNFKGCRALDLEFGPGNTAIHGRNEAGKTTVADAWCWLLTGKDSAGRADGEIKTLQADGTAVHNLDHSVEAVVKVDGQRLTLSRTLAEKWTKKRGAAQAEFTAHVTSYAVDGVPVTEAIYREKVREVLGDEERVLLLTLPGWFSERLHWQARRRLLMEACGDVDQMAVIASDPELRELPGILGKRTVDEQRAVSVTHGKKVNAELKELPARIDEAMRVLDAAAGDAAHPEELPQRIAEAQEAVRQAQQAEADARAAGGAAQTRAAILDAETALGRLRAERRANLAEATAAVKSEIAAARDRKASVVEAMNAATRRIQQLATEAAAADALAAAKREEWAFINAETLIEEDQATSCPACGQPLAPEQVAAAARKALEAFHASKAKRLEAVIADGRTAATNAKEAHALITEAESRMEALRQEGAGIDAGAQAAQDKLAALVAQDLPSAEEQAAESRLKSLLASAHDGITAASMLAEAAVERTREAQAKVDALLRQEAAVAARKQVLSRVAELQRAEKRLAAEYERIQRELYLLDKFVVAKVDLLESRINAKFEHARFRLFERQINGGLAECCEVTYRGVPYGDLNHAAKVNVGLDVIRALQQHFGVQMPVWVDARESVTRLIPVGGQVISLVVSPRDERLRLESEGGIQ